MDSYSTVPFAPEYLSSVRLILSFGMLFAFAFAMTSRNLLLLSGSGPPSLTATAISLPMTVKIFPFFASFFSFLCLMFANLLCPDVFFFLPFPFFYLYLSNHVVMNINRFKGISLVDNFYFFIVFW